MVTSRRSRLALAATVVAMAMTACTPVVDDPGKVPSSSSAPSSSPTPTVGTAAVVVISSVGIEVRDAADAVVDAHAYSDDPAAVVRMLSSAFDAEPEVIVAGADDECGAGTTSYSWNEGGGSLIVTTAPVDAPAPWDTLDVRLSASVIGAMPIMTSAGFSVGDEVSELVASLPADQRDDQVGAFIWERSGTYESPVGPQAFGGYASFADDGVGFIATPGTLGSWYC
jgi:hypothetical protein